MSMRFPEGAPRMVMPNMGGDKTVPEFQGEGFDRLCDPFKVDVYCMGNVVRRTFLSGWRGYGPGYRGLEFLATLITEMTQEDPSKRLTMSDALSSLDEIVSGLYQWKLRSPAVPKDEFSLISLVKNVGRWNRSRAS
ncbi:hypothetical protein BDV98DRAFT_97859 [Pterulicium gracile]|uniref:Protein kinase domain-containing protein n=1 Tax=Pterulicium gracile TaxID=1884261 RepID=A0A5C3QK69_9AGAR|nr:hypothetical protein BDV98DRAFT_97859 [Pterula gracilis]